MSGEQIQNPKSEIRNKSEIQILETAGSALPHGFGDFKLLLAALFRISRFGFRISAGVVLALSIFLSPARTAPAAEPLAIPAAGIIDLDEFTIEMWVMLAFDPQEHHEGQRNHGFVYEINYGDAKFPESSLHWFVFSEFFPREKQMWTRLYNQVFDPITGDRLTYSLLGNFPQDATRNSWHHLAVSFSGRTRRMYMNGVEISNSEMSGPFAHPLRSTAVLRLGTDRRKLDSHLAFDEVRVSSIARPRDQLGFFAKEPLKPDRHTTLLLNFDEAERSADGATIKPTFAATPQVATGVTKPPAGRWIDGKFGKALLLAPQPSE